MLLLGCMHNFLQVRSDLHDACWLHCFQVVVTLNCISETSINQTINQTINLSMNVHMLSLDLIMGVRKSSLHGLIILNETSHPLF